MQRSVPGPASGRLASAISCLTVLLVVTGCTSGPGTGSAPTPRPTVTSAPPATPSEQPSQSPSPSPSSTAPKIPTATARFTKTYPAFEDGELMLPTDYGYLIATGTTVLGIDPSGHTRWKAAAPEDRIDDSTRRNVRTTGDAVMITYGIKGQEWPGLEMIKVLDARTGKKLWQDRTTSFASVWGDTIYSSVCIGKQQDHIGDCTLSARDPRTGANRWSVATYASAQIEALDSGHLLEHAYPTGSPGSYRVRDAATGQPLGPWVPADDLTDATLIGDTLVVVGEEDRNSSDGCKQTVRGYSATGKLRWRRSVTTGQDPYGKGGCAADSLEPGEDGLVTADWYDGTPEVIDTRTGSVLWRGAAHGELPLVSRSLVLALTPRADEVLTAYDPGSGKNQGKTRAKKLWTLTAPLGDGGATGLPTRWTLIGNRLLGSDEDCDTGCRTLAVTARTGAITTSYDGAYLDADLDHQHGRLATDDDSEGRVTYRVYDWA